MKKITGIGIVCFMFALACLCMFLLTGAGSACYYSQIDNSRLEQGEARKGVIDLKGGMAFYYTLLSYDEKRPGKRHYLRNLKRIKGRRFYPPDRNAHPGRYRMERSTV